MPNHQQLDNIRHKDLRVLTVHQASFAENASYGHVYLAEFRYVQGEYPIFFRKNAETAQFEAIALFGLAAEENLYVEENGWNASYVPLTVQRRPFLIGFQHDNQSDPKPVLYIDMDSPRISQSAVEGEAVFLPQGGQTPYLQHINAILSSIHTGHIENKTFIDTLLQHDLIESVAIKVELHDTSKLEFNNLYTINEEKLNALSAETFFALHQQGYVNMIYMVIASMATLSRLIDLKNKRVKGL
ncbi:SapC family protein [Paraglaciecola sp.]|uniref:SapC family protein n=1 Tax=Paraglaciecola sp. TaxID=1920173 RepID=UPI0030F4A4A7